jgi:hypothetical protein
MRAAAYQLGRWLQLLDTGSIDLVGVKRAACRLAIWKPLVEK